MGTGAKDVQMAMVPLHGAIVQAVIHDVPLFVCPPGMSVDVLEVGLVCGTIAPAGGSIVADLEHVDAAETITDWTGTASAVNLETLDTLTAVVVSKLKRKLTAGEWVNLEVTTDNNTVTAIGDVTAYVLWKVKSRSGDV